MGIKINIFIILKVKSMTNSLLIITSIIFGLMNCATPRTKDSIFNTDNQNILAKSTQTNQKNRPYLAKHRVKIKKNTKQNQYGSLWRSDDKRNWFFQNPGRVQHGKTILVKLPAPLKNSAKQEEIDSKNIALNKKNTNYKKPNNKKEEYDSFLEQLTKYEKAFKDLSIKGNNTASLSKTFRAKVIEVTSQGKVKLQFRRYSKTTHEENYLLLKAATNLNAINEKNIVSVDDLYDVSIYQNTNGEIKNSSSIGWTDEYTQTIHSFFGALTGKEQRIREQRKLIKHSRKKILQKLKHLRLNYKKLTEKQRKIEELERRLKDQQKAEKEDSVSNTQDKEKETKKEKINLTEQIEKKRLPK